MAINPETQYPGKITASSANYPYGQARNITVPGDGTGTPWEAALVNDIFGMQQALLSEAGITPTGNPETAVASQYLNAMHTLNPRVFDTYDTDLAAYTPLGDEQVVYVKGKASVGDGGAGLFYYDLASTTWLPLFGYTNSQGIKNKIINGNFDLWDYSTSQTSSGYGSDNRWENINSGSTKTHSRQSFTLGQTDVPGNPEYFSRTVVTTGGGIADFTAKRQLIRFVKTFSGGPCTLSFWAKADSSKNIATEFIQDFGTTGSPSATVSGIGVTTHSLTTSWQKFTVTASIPSVSGKTIGTDLNDSFRLQFWFDAGSNYDARTNSLGNQSGTFDIAQVQVENGPVDTQFEDRGEDIERTMSRFYFRRIDTTLNRATFSGGRILTATTAGGYILFNRMRTGPSVTVSSQTGIDVGDGGGSVQSTAVAFAEPTEQTVAISVTGAAFANVGGGTTLRIRSGEYIDLNAEL